MNHGIDTSQDATSTRVRELMLTNVEVLRETDSIREAVRILASIQIPMVPVVNNEDAVVGIVSDDDLLLEEATIPMPQVIGLLGDVAVWPPAMRRLSKDLKKAFANTVNEAMTTDYETISPEDTVEHAATIMHEKHLGALLVTKNDRVAGIITAKALLGEFFKAL